MLLPMKLGREKLNPRESSACGTVGYVRARSEFAGAAKRLAQARLPRVVYTDFETSAFARMPVVNVSAHQYIAAFTDHVTHLSEAKPMSLAVFHETVDDVRLMQRDVVAINALNAFEKEVVNMMHGFETWKIHTLRYRYRIPKSINGSTVPNWHVDVPVRGARAIVLCKTTLGPSTVMSPVPTRDPQVNEFLKITPPDSVLTAHVPGVTYHRSPDTADAPGYRQALVLKIAPK